MFRSRSGRIEYTILPVEFNTSFLHNAPKINTLIDVVVQGHGHGMEGASCDGLIAGGYAYSLW